MSGLIMTLIVIALALIVPVFILRAGRQEPASCCEHCQDQAIEVERPIA